MKETKDYQNLGVLYKILDGLMVFIVGLVFTSGVYFLSNLIFQQWVAIILTALTATGVGYFLIFDGWFGTYFPDLHDRLIHHEYGIPDDAEDD